MTFYIFYFCIAPGDAVAFHPKLSIPLLPLFSNINFGCKKAISIFLHKKGMTKWHSFFTSTINSPTYPDKG